MENLKKMLINNLNKNLCRCDATYGYYIYDTNQRKRVYLRELKKINIFVKNYKNMTIEFFRNNCDIGTYCDITELNHKKFSSYQDAIDAGAVAAFAFNNGNLII